MTSLLCKGTNKDGFIKVDDYLWVVFYLDKNRHLAHYYEK